MSTYYYLYCPECKQRSSVAHAQQVWGSWTEKEGLHDWLLEHRDHKPYLVDEHSKEVDDCLFAEMETQIEVNKE